MTDRHAFILDQLKSTAADQMAAFPQYASAFDSRFLVRIQRDVETKMGLAFRMGEFALQSVEAPHFAYTSGERFVTVWSMRNRCDTSVPASAVRRIAS